MAIQTEETTVRYALNIPASLNALIEREAKKEKRKKSQQCVFMIEKFFENLDDTNNSLQYANNPDEN